MERYTDLEEFAKGGRISPERSATEPPKGTLGVGVNGNVWVNVPDKNGRLSWKPTPLNDTFRKLYPFIQIRDAKSNGVWFQIEDKNFLFRFEYGYEKDSIYTIEYKNTDGSDVLIEKENSFEALDNSFFQDFTEFEYNTFNPDGILSYKLIKEGVMYLFAMLKKMIDDKVLRSADETPETPKEKPKYTNGKLFIDAKRNLKIVDEDNFIPFLETENFERFIPAFDSPEYITFSTTTKAQAEENISIGFTLDYKKGFDFFIQSDKLNFHKKEIKNIQRALDTYNEIAEYLNAEKTPQLYREFVVAVYNIINSVNDNTIQYDWREGSAFKVGDKVYLPQTKRGQEITKGMSNAYDRAVKYKRNYLYVTDIDFPQIVLNDLMVSDGDGDFFNENMDDLALYQEPTPTPQPQPDLPKEDCEADPTKIVSSQVKRFYDLNKSRIDKLNPKFSCKIIQALVSLSDYESCGSPSSESLPKPKVDLLSDIKNFKI